MIGLLGDVHGKFGDALKMMSGLPDVGLWLQVGDFGGEGLEYPPDLPGNFHFIQGNHENWAALRGMGEAPRGPFMRNGNIYEFDVGGAAIRVAALGGNFSPKWFGETRANVPGSRDRHYLREEIEAITSDAKGADILLTHEAPSPYPPDGKWSDRGKPEVSGLAALLRPRLHAFGHHHYYGVYDYGGVRTIGLGYGWSHAVLWDEGTGDFEWVGMP